VDHLADDVAERPRVRRRVDDSVEWDTEDKEGEVGDSQVDNEDVGGAGVLLAVADDDDNDKDVADAAKNDDDAEDERNDEALIADVATYVVVVVVLRDVAVCLVVMHAFHGSVVVSHLDKVHTAKTHLLQLFTTFSNYDDYDDDDTRTIYKAT